jgi:hypothetical protein
METYLEIDFTIGEDFAQLVKETDQVFFLDNTSSPVLWTLWIALPKESRLTIVRYSNKPEEVEWLLREHLAKKIFWHATYEVIKP